MFCLKICDMPFDNLQDLPVSRPVVVSSYVMQLTKKFFINS